MTTISSGQAGTMIAPGRRHAALPLVVVALALASGAAGCGSSDSNATDEYSGTWAVDRETSHFTLSCTIVGEPLEFALWTSTRIEQGTLSDLVELAGPCPTYFDITSKGIATMASPDPFTGEAPFCDVSVASDGSQFLELQYTQWELRLLAPVKGKAPTGQMIGSASGQLFLVDPNTEVATPQDRGDCTYVVNANLTKIGKN